MIDNTKYGENYTEYYEGATDTLSKSEDYEDTGFFVPDVPVWGIKDYINTLQDFKKGLTINSAEPGWFYFKIFFKFNTKYGLFGGLINTEDMPINTAGKYLADIQHTYTLENINARRIALYKFAILMSNISSNAPWFFSSISGLNDASNITTQNNGKNELNITCLEEATDMRITSLFDLYKYACFDTANNKEIIPENLRKFDMTVVIYEMPIKYYQTGFTYMANSGRPSKNKSFKFKTLNDMDMYNRMSFKAFNFINCEFDYNSLNNIYAATYDNKDAFKINPSFKIKYDRCFTTNMNEWLDYCFNVNGFEHNNTEFTHNIYDRTLEEDLETAGLGELHVCSEEQFNSRFQTIKTSLNNSFYKKSPDGKTYRALVTATEFAIQDAMAWADGKNLLGNIYNPNDSYNSMSNFGKNFKNMGKDLKNSFKDSGKALKKSFKFW